MSTSIPPTRFPLRLRSSTIPDHQTHVVGRVTAAAHPSSAFIQAPLSSNTTNSTFDPTNVGLTSVDATEVICYLGLGTNDCNGQLGARISALFVILIVSTAATFSPVLAADPRLCLLVCALLWCGCDRCHGLRSVSLLPMPLLTEHLLSIWIV